MNAIQIKDGIYWVGALDWHLRNFHGYTTNRGATYNCLLYTSIDPLHELTAEQPSGSVDMAA